MNSLYIHLGYPKTASTTLQQGVFARHPKIQHLGRPFCDQNLEKHMEELLFEDTISYNNRRFKDLIDNYRKIPGSKIRTLSEEDCLMHFTQDNGIIAERIQETFSPCKIIITIRNQLDLLKSYCLANFKALQPLAKKTSFEEWITLMCDFNRPHHYKTQMLYNLEYYKIIKHFSGIFGVSNLKILLFEDLVHHPEKFAHELACFMGIPGDDCLRLVKTRHLNPSKTSFLVFYENLKKRLTSRKLKSSKAKHWLAGHIENAMAKQGKRFKLGKTDCDKKLASLFAPGNRQLLKEFGLPLIMYNYPTSLSEQNW